jgi:hypothetical protein
MKRSRTRPDEPPGQASVPGTGNVVLSLYLLFVAMTFLSLSKRYEVVGSLRPTLILVVLISFGIVSNAPRSLNALRTEPSRWIWILFLYIFVSLPFVTWPGSVLKANLEVFVRAIVFYFFTVSIIDTEFRLKAFLFVFVGTQVFRVLEPLYLHVTTGYWGSSTFMAGEFMSRLAGAPADIINSNGLASVILTALPFVHFWALDKKSVARIGVYVFLAGAMGWALLLTASRSGMIGLLVALVAIGLMHRHSWRVIAAVGLGAVLFFSSLGGLQRDRYESIYRSDVAGASTAKGRIEGIFTDIRVGLSRPIFGHGLGTSAEALFNEAGGTHKSHNMYTETLIELGVIGLFILLRYLMAISAPVVRIARAVRSGDLANQSGVLTWVPKALLVWITTNLVFSLAAYGLSNYDWYLVGGLAVCVARLMQERRPQPAAEGDSGRRKTGARLLRPVVTP